MGLGPFPDVSLAEARDAASEYRAQLRKGLDPIHEKRRAVETARRNSHLLKDVALEAFEARKAELRGDGKAGRWFSPLELHVLPRLGDVPVVEIDQIYIRDTLGPIWHDKASTATKALQRLGICLQHAAALGLDVDLQATQKARALLGQQRHTVEHIPAMPWQEVPAFYQSLGELSSCQLALRFLILTGVRSRPIRYLRHEEVEGMIWTVPAQLMKGRRGKTEAFRVPLSEEARRVLDIADKNARDGFLFPSPRRGVISDATMLQHMKRQGLPYKPHGFRSSLRDWIAEATDAPREVGESMLGHATGGKVERSYKRTDFFEQRKQLADRWSNFLTSHT